jgi:type I restriction enzyme, R subunit
MGTDLRRTADDTWAPADKVVITTIQRLYSLLKGEPDLDPEVEEGSQWVTFGEPAIDIAPGRA